MYYLPLTAFFADVLRWIFCSPPLFTHGKFLVGRMGQMPEVHPTMTLQKPHSAWLSRVSSRSEGNIKQGFTKTGSRKKGPCWLSCAAPVFVHLRIFPRRAWFSFFIKEERLPRRKRIREDAVCSVRLLKDLCIVLEILKSESGYCDTWFVLLFWYSIKKLTWFIGLFVNLLFHAI